MVSLAILQVSVLLEFEHHRSHVEVIELLRSGKAV